MIMKLDEKDVNFLLEKVSTRRTTNQVKKELIESEHWSKENTHSNLRALLKDLAHKIKIIKDYTVKKYIYIYHF